jgi:acyl-CoA synthetase (AMP-forming)/AMP-acid ligase II
MKFNKAVGALLAAAAFVAIQWIDTGQFNLSAEFVTAVYGVVAAGAVYVVRNLPSDPARKSATAGLLAAAAIAIQWVTTGHLNVTQEFVTAATGLVAALVVYYVPNFGPVIDRFGSEAVGVRRT